jgi:hypothetical protein
MHVSYKATKYSDFRENDFFQIRINILCYNNFMTEKEYDGPNCCAGCTCTTGHSSKPLDSAI